MSEKFTFWTGWEADDTIPDEHTVASWPKGMKGWRSGYGEGFSTWTARVDAATPQEAEKIVRSCYSKSGAKIRMRWEPEQNKLGWRPLGGRFPE